MGATTPSEALAELQEGNDRFVGERPRSVRLRARVLELAGGQDPFAIVLGCADSRVPIETIFDQIPGNLFVVRVAGNFLNDDNFGSIEFGVAVLNAKLIVVLGHTECGALSAAVSYVKDGITQPGRIQHLVTALAPAAEATRDVPGDWVANAVAENVKRNVAAMTAGSKIIAEAVAGGSVEVAGGIYNLHSGRVEFS